MRSASTVPDTPFYAGARVTVLDVESGTTALPMPYAPSTHWNVSIEISGEYPARPPMIIQEWDHSIYRGQRISHAVKQGVFLVGRAKTPAELDDTLTTFHDYSASWYTKQSLSHHFLPLVFPALIGRASEEAWVPEIDYSSHTIHVTSLPRGKRFYWFGGLDASRVTPEVSELPENEIAVRVGFGTALQELFAAFSNESFEYGEPGEFDLRLASLLAAAGRRGLLTLRKLLFDDRSISTETATEALAVIGRSDAAGTTESRRRFLVEFLSHSRGAMRYAAALALSDLGDGRAVEGLRAAVASEGDPLIQRTIDAVIASLSNTL